MEANFLESQNKVFRLKNDILHYKEQLQIKDKEILELNEELHTLKEELIMRLDYRGAW